MPTLEELVRLAVDPVDAVHPAPPGDQRAAAVLLLLDRRQATLPLLFMQRSAHLRHHAGEVGFPGGVTEPGDRDVVATALREADEEAGVPREAVDVAGLLPPFMTATSDRWLTPVVGFQSSPVSLRPDGFEVARLFSVPLADLAGAPHTVHRLVRDGIARDVHFYSAGEDVIWGVTGAIIAELLRRVEERRLSAGQR